MDNLLNRIQGTQKGVKGKGALKRPAAYIVRVAVMSALLTAGKFALSFIPNVEVVTLLILVYVSVFGMSYAFPAVLIFCLTEAAIYGAGSWILLYFVYWPLLTLAGAAFLRRRNLIAAAAVAGVGSILFGLLSAGAETLVMSVNLAPDRMGAYWLAYYVRGLYFDLVHTVSSVVTVALLYKPLAAVALRVAPISERTLYSKSSAAFSQFRAESPDDQADVEV